MKQKQQSELVLIIMRVLTWVAFLAFCVQAGPYLFSYIVSIFNPVAATNIYKGLDLHVLYDYSFSQYTFIVSYYFMFEVMKAYIAFLLVKILTEIKLENPFTISMTKWLERMSYAIVGFWIVGIIYNGHSAWLMKRLPIELDKFPVDLIFMAGVVLVISQVFKRGVEIQTESDLTV